MSAEEPKDLTPKPKDDAPGKADALALGIGCLVFLIMFAAVVIVAATRE